MQENHPITNSGSRGFIGGKIVSCVAGYDRGGLGQHFTWAVEQARAAGQLRRYYTGQIKPGDQGVGFELHDRLGPWLMRWTPLRFSPGGCNHLENDRFDRAVARRLTDAAGNDGDDSNAPEVFLGFGGQSLRSFHAARKLGCRRLELLAANSHVNNVARGHARAIARCPVEKSWLSTAQRRKTLAEYREADVIYIASQYSWDTFIAEGVPASKLVRIHYPPAVRFRPPTEAERSAQSDDGVFRVVYVGAVTVMKGVADLLEAFWRFTSRKAELTLVGGTGTRGMNLYVAQCLARDSRVRLAPGDPLPHLWRANAYVHAAYEDNLPYATLEALAAGTPVIVSADTGAKEYVREGVNGYVIPTADSDAILDRLEMLARKPMRVTQGVPAGEYAHRGVASGVTTEVSR